MKATAFSSQSVTTFADAVVMGVKRHAASNNHALLRVMTILRDVRHVWPELRAYRPIAKASAGGEVAPACRTWGCSPLVTTLGLPTLSLPHASQQVLGSDLNRSESVGAGPLPSLFAPMAASRLQM